MISGGRVFGFSDSDSGVGSFCGKGGLGRGGRSMFGGEGGSGGSGSSN